MMDFACLLYGHCVPAQGEVTAKSHDMRLAVEKLGSKMGELIDIHSSLTLVTSF